MSYKFVPYYEDYDHFVMIDDEIYNEHFRSFDYPDASKWFKKVTITRKQFSGFDLTSYWVKPKVKRDENNKILLDENDEPIITTVRENMPLEEYKEYTKFLSEGYDHDIEVIEKYDGIKRCMMYRKQDYEIYILEFENMDDLMEFNQHFDIDFTFIGYEHFLNGDTLKPCLIVWV